jgi:hypothetical protein
MTRGGAVKMVCTYWPKKGGERRLLGLLEAHWPTLREAGLASAEPPQLYRGTDRKGRACFVEVFEWKDGRAAVRAHEHPEVMALWGPMEELAQAMEFVEIEPLPRRRGRAGRARGRVAGKRAPPELR